MPSDRERITEIMDTFYRILSGSAVEAHDWDGLHRLFVPGASILALGRSGDPMGSLQAEDVGHYVGRLASSLTGRAFFERGFDYEVSVAGSIAHVNSRYEASATPDFAPILKSGTNMIHLVRKGSDWRIAGMLYEDDPETSESG